MLPVGHIAGGYLISKAFLQIVPGDLNPEKKEKLAWCGAIFGFLPDLDVFYAFYRSAALTINHSVANHRIYLTHTPLIWLVLGLMVVLVFWKRKFWQKFGIVVWLGAWSHMLLDSIDYGVRWLWPYSGEVYALRAGVAKWNDDGKFTNYWWRFLQSYSHTPTFYAEIAIILLAVIIFYKSNKLFINKIWQDSK